VFADKIYCHFNIITVIIVLLFFIAKENGMKLSSKYSSMGFVQLLANIVVEVVRKTNIKKYILDFSNTFTNF